MFAEKIFLLGEPGAGKSAFLTRLHENTFNGSASNTQGFDSETITSNIDEHSLDINCWDRPGQQVGYAEASQWYNDVTTFLICIDAQKSLEDAKKEYETWANFTKGRGNSNAKIILVLTHSDKDNTSLLEDGAWQKITEDHSRQADATISVSSKNNTLTPLQAEGDSGTQYSIAKKDSGIDFSAWYAKTFMKEKKQTSSVKQLAVENLDTAGKLKDYLFTRHTYRDMICAPSFVTVCGSYRKNGLAGVASNWVLSTALCAAMGAALGAITGLFWMGPPGLLIGAAWGAVAGAAAGGLVGLLLSEMVPTLLLAVVGVLFLPLTIVLDKLDEKVLHRLPCLDGKRLAEHWIQLTEDDREPAKKSSTSTKSSEPITMASMLAASRREPSDNARVLMAQGRESVNEHKGTGLRSTW